MSAVNNAFEGSQPIQRPLRPARRPFRFGGKEFGNVLFYLAILFFLVNLIAQVSTVVIDSFGQSWFKTLLPTGFTGQWYPALTQDYDMQSILFNTIFVALMTTLIALLIGFPAAYILARKQFRFKPWLMGLYLLPMMVPPLVYGIPLATLLIRLGLGGSLIGIIVINLVPIVPFIILILTPFIEQVDISLESASRMLGAGRIRTFRRVVLPLVIPGLLTAGILAAVRTIGQFDLTYLVSTTASSQTLVVVLYGEISAAGIRAHQELNAMAVVYMMTTMTLVVIALIWVKPTQFVVRIKNR